MKVVLIILGMTLIGALIGGVTNMIAIKMLFHPFKAYYIFGKRIPFTPGLVPKRREEIASKIGQVVEEHLLTESLVREKITSEAMHTSIYNTVQQQITALQSDKVTLQSLVQDFHIDLHEKTETWIKHFLNERLNKKYLEIENEQIETLVPQNLMHTIDEKVLQIDEVILKRARYYISSDKGYHDIFEMIETFFNEKSRILSMLQMFMTKEAIAERVQAELLRLSEHPKAKRILKTQIQEEYQRLKSMPIRDIVTKDQFNDKLEKFIEECISHLQIKQKMHTPLNRLVPDMFTYLKSEGAEKLTAFIISTLAKRLTSIFKKVNIAGLVEEQINRFDLDYIERLIFEIANKELKLIMLLGFILGGIIGFFQGLIAIFV
ncbi:MULTISPECIES: DUF445 domain-containing protein [Staphylococcus]|uniref:DUF445 domain-containing protein n=1 Tax=Staphylococcus TaxID=1279 RepID=UPI000D0348B0|nr:MULTISPECIES: DUF445 family protein [Staphylococcus]NHM76449.1 DUF445 domain-containing protein [Staphylococcus sp. 11511212]PTF57635.1 DUF445 domain-containing protein [Staphylococcus chromogenes]PTF75019.1 DUF445 domain-containing protein [Staphylococcus chromogenes]PTF89665.1 DUF445 domain-containing protein [Staphylococcus chromogenes]PTG46631.1 DUF445 domain-containing protein [Staphylococcus chromogenes]